MMRKLNSKMIEVPKLNFETVSKEIVDFIKANVKAARAEGVVVGLSGGVDSSVVAALCVCALGKNKVLGILMPTSFTPAEDVEDAIDLASWLGIRTELLNIQPIGDVLFTNLHVDKNSSKRRIPIANVYARLRMIILYFFANFNNYLVVGTGDRSEDLIGYFTKYGDGGVDFLPISHLYKTQVRQLAKHLGIFEKIADKPSSPQLYPGHKASDEIPLDYENLDPLLIGLFDRKFSSEEVCNLTKTPVDTVDKILRRFNMSKHKRVYPPMIRAW